MKLNCEAITIQGLTNILSKRNPLVRKAGAPSTSSTPKVKLTLGPKTKTDSKRQTGRTTPKTERKSEGFDSKRSSRDHWKVSSLRIPADINCIIDHSEDCSSSVRLRLASFSFHDRAIRPDDNRSKKESNSKLFQKPILLTQPKQPPTKSKLKVDGAILMGAASMSERNRLHNFFLNDYVGSLATAGNWDSHSKEEAMYHRVRDRLKAIEHMRSRMAFVRINPSVDSSLRNLVFSTDIKKPTMKILADPEEVDRRSAEILR